LKKQYVKRRPEKLCNPRCRCFIGAKREINVPVTADHVGIKIGKTNSARRVYFVRWVSFGLYTEDQKARSLGEDEQANLGIINDFEPDTL